MLIQFHTKLVFRSLKAQKIYSLISLLSLSLAFVSVLLITMWVVNELSYDRHFPKHNRIQRLTLQHKTPDGYESHFARVAQGWVLQVGDFIPEIENTCRFAPKRHALINIGENKFFSDRAFSTDTTVFKVFDLQLIEGDESSSLKNPFCVLLSESISKKYFGDASPLGEYISLIGQNEDKQKQYLVTGVYKDFPEATHFHPELLLSFEDPKQYGWSYFYLLLNKNTNREFLQSKLDDYIKAKVDSANVGNYSLHFQALSDIHLYSHKDREIELNGNIQSIYILAGIALMILFIGIFNYLNLNIAQLFKEIRFLIINKVYGASSGSIFQYQLYKSVLITGLSTVLAIIILYSVTPALSNRLNIILLTKDNSVLIFLTLLILFFISTLAGSLPAFQFIISRFNQKMVIRHSNLVRLFHPQKKFLMRKILIGMQFCISTVLIILTIFAGLQMDYISSKWMGNNPDNQIIIIENLSFPIRAKYSEFRDELLKSPYLDEVSATMEIPPSPIKDAFEFEADSPVKADNLIMYLGPVADNFFKFYDQTIVAGSDFPKYIKDQKFESYILNETAAKFLGWNDPADAIGKSFKFNFMAEGFFFGGKIHGVVKDFHQTSLHHQISPTVYFQQPAFYLSFLIKVKNKNTSLALEYVENTWDNLFPAYPFAYVYQKQLYEEAYAREETQTRLAGIFTILAIIITLAGLIGLTTILTGQRTKEVGIRKVLGASTSDILIKLSHEIMIILTISVVAAVLLSFFLVGEWLQNFAYSIMVGNYWWVPIVISIFLILLTSLILLITTYYTSNKNPIESLKWE